MTGPLGKSLHMNSRKRLSITEGNKDGAWILIGIVLNLVINLESIAILTVLNILIHEHGYLSIYLDLLIMLSSVQNVCVHFFR